MNHTSQHLRTRVMVTLGLFLLILVAVFHPAFAQTPTLITVNTIDDELNSDGDCSLREAITAANTNAAVDACAAGVPGADTISFGVTGTIILGSTLPAIADYLTLNGPGAASLTISGNNAVRVLTVNAGSTLNLQGVTVANGSADNDFIFPSLVSGGGIWNNGTLTVSNSTFLGNHAGPQGTGGGIKNDHGTLIVSNSTFSGNSTRDGGAIFNFGGTLTVSDSTFSGNSVSSAGGAIYNAGLPNSTITNSTFYNNSSVGFARGVAAGNAGAIANSGTLTVSNSTFSGNSANSNGGGIFSFATLTVLNTTFSGNRADNTGGGIANLGTSILRNTIVANNTGPSGSNCSGAIIDGGGNLDNGTSCGFRVATSKSSANPGLDPSGLQNNGGPTLTIALVAGSAAIDMAVAANCPSTDQRGVSRPQGPACDIGAFELVNQPPTANAGGPYNVGEGGSVGVTASGTDSEGGPLTYAWDLDNNGTFETAGQNPTFLVANLDGPSSHTIKVQVTDNGGLSAIGETTVDIANVAPTATFNSPTAVDEGSAFSLSLTSPADSSSDDTTAGFSYAFDCGDGVGYGAFGSGNSANCPTSDNGSRTVKGTIRDKDGGATEYTTVMTVDPVAPTASFAVTPGTLLPRQAATLSFSQPFDPSPADVAAGFNYSYDCNNDGTFEASSIVATSFACTYSSAGPVTARGRIADKDGALSEYTVQVTVLTPRQGIDGLIEKVKALFPNPLNQGEENALLTKLEAAEKDLDRGRVADAIKKLQDFIDKVNDLMKKGRLTSADGQPLIDAANEIIAALGG